ncbi:MAG: nucleotide exchange factor GrpE [Aquabacterium sp.]|nr:MAG: nucleotide exchange factor GrpE [Aquabacterium sp.]
MSHQNENYPENQSVENETSTDSSASDPGLQPQDLARAQEAKVPEGELDPRLIELQDQVLRARAEAENIRRRSQEEISKARKFAVESFAESLLPVRDSLEAAITAHAAGQTTSVEQLLEGVHATLRQLASALERNKVLEINPAAGTRFDPHQHQAISMVPSELEPNAVVTVLQKGYLIADRVLRPALVTVSAPR